MLKIDQLPRECPVCKAEGAMVYLQGHDGWSFMCLTCVGAPLEHVREYARERGYNLVVGYPNQRYGIKCTRCGGPCTDNGACAACEAPRPEHSRLSEPLTVDDVLYEVLGYYS